MDKYELVSCGNPECFHRFFQKEEKTECPVCGNKKDHFPVTKIIKQGKAD